MLTKSSPWLFVALLASVCAETALAQNLIGLTEVQVSTGGGGGVNLEFGFDGPNTSSASQSLERGGSALGHAPFFLVG